MNRMSERQKRFCDLYLKYGNAERAATEAGYSRKYAHAQSYKLLDNIGIRTYLETRLKKIESERIASADEVMRYLTEVMRGNLHITKDRLKAAELIGKRYALFVENIALSGDVGVQIINDIPKDSG